MKRRLPFSTRNSAISLRRTCRVCASFTHTCSEFTDSETMASSSPSSFAAFAPTASVDDIGLHYTFSSILRFQPAFRQVTTVLGFDDAEPGSHDSLVRVNSYVTQKFFRCRFHTIPQLYAV